MFIANVSLSKHSVGLLEQLVYSHVLQIDKPTTHGYHECFQKQPLGFCLTCNMM